MAQEAPPFVVHLADAPEVIARDIGDAVVTRQPLVHEGVVGRVEIEDGAVFADQCVEERLRLLQHRALQRLVEVRIDPHVGLDLLQILEPQPLSGEAG